MSKRLQLRPQSHPCGSSAKDDRLFCEAAAQLFLDAGALLPVPPEAAAQLFLDAGALLPVPPAASLGNDRFARPGRKASSV